MKNYEDYIYKKFDNEIIAKEVMNEDIIKYERKRIGWWLGEKEIVRIEWWMNWEDCSWLRIDKDINVQKWLYRESLRIILKI